MTKFFKNIASDAEVILLSKEGTPVSAEDIIPGTKDDPYMFNEKNQCLVHNDNVLAEFSTRPHDNFEGFWGDIKASLSYIGFKAHPAKYLIHPYAEFPEDELESEVAKMYGCSPDSNIYDENHEDKFSAETNDRYCGGHIHLGYDVENVEAKEIVDKKVIFALDVILGIPSVVLDDCKERRSTYGIAGRFRTKSYGAEYRTLSNFWLKDEKLARWIFDRAQFAVDNRDAISDIFVRKWIHVREIINNSRVDLAKKYISKYSLIMPDRLESLNKSKTSVTVEFQKNRQKAVEA